MAMKPMNMRWTQELTEDFVRRWVAGESAKSLAERFWGIGAGVHHVHNRSFQLRKLGVPLPHRERKGPGGSTLNIAALAAIVKEGK